MPKHKISYLNQPCQAAQISDRVKLMKKVAQGDYDYDCPTKEARINEINYQFELAKSYLNSYHEWLIQEVGKQND